MMFAMTISKQETLAKPWFFLYKKSWGWVFNWSVPAQPFSKSCLADSCWAACRHTWEHENRGMSEQWQTALALLLRFSLSHFWLFQDGLWVLDVLACKTHLEFAWCFRLLLEMICWRRRVDKMIFCLSARRCFCPTRQAHHILRNLCSRKFLPDLAHNLGSSPCTFVLSYQWVWHMLP